MHKATAEGRAHELTWPSCFIRLKRILVMAGMLFSYDAVQLSSHICCMTNSVHIQRNCFHQDPGPTDL
jgi:hypothetical protein